MDLIALQVPVPQSQFTGLQGQGQALFALAQCVVGLVQRASALGHPRLQADLRFAQLLLDQSPLLYFASERLIKALAAALGHLQVFDQCLVLEALEQAVFDQPVDLPGHHRQSTQHNQSKPAPAPLLLVTPPEQKGDRWQQTGQGKTEKSRQTDGIGDTGRQGSRTQQAKHPGLLSKVIHRDQSNRGTTQGQATECRAQQKHSSPGRLSLALRHGGIKRRHLDNPQSNQRHQPDHPDAYLQVAHRAPEQPGTDQTVEQHEQGGQQRALIEQTSALHRQLHCELLANTPACLQWHADGAGTRCHRQCSCNG
ncbi:hypothetical protein D3C77_335500 [compost metagenome]